MEQSLRSGHLVKGSEILRQLGYLDDLVHAIPAYADLTGVSGSSLLDYVAFVGDEISGFLVACALVKPSGSLLDADTTSVEKKLEDKAFARGVNRQDIMRGAQEPGISLEDHIDFWMHAVRSIASEIGLDRTGGN